MVAVEPGKWPLKTPSSILWQWLCDTNLRGGSLMSDLVASSATEECHSASSFEVTSKTSSSLAASDLSSFSMALSIPMAHVSYSSRCSTHSPGKSRSCMRCAQRDASTAQRRGSCVFFHRERARSGCPDTTAQSIRSHQTGRMYETRSRDRTSEIHTHDASLSDQHGVLLRRVGREGHRRPAHVIDPNSRIAGPHGALVLVLVWPALRTGPLAGPLLAFRRGNEDSPPLLVACRLARDSECAKGCVPQSIKMDKSYLRIVLNERLGHRCVA
eukprot:scaffold183_cov108-Isochrysis_galbana.AAC.4